MSLNVCELNLDKYNLLIQFFTSLLSYSHLHLFLENRDLC